MNGENDTPKGTKPSNPKDSIGSDKLPLHLWPSAATAMGCVGMLEGTTKYGRNNFRATEVRYTIYLDACRRHLDAILEGENHAPDTLNHHLCNALASLGIIADAMANGTLIDDRNYIPHHGNWRQFIDGLTLHVKRLKTMFADRHPRHYTIEDNLHEDIARQFGTDLPPSVNCESATRAGDVKNLKEQMFRQYESRLNATPSCPDIAKTQDYREDSHPRCVRTCCAYPMTCAHAGVCVVRQREEQEKAQQQQAQQRTVAVSAQGVHAIGGSRSSGSTARAGTSLLRPAIVIRQAAEDIREGQLVEVTPDGLRLFRGTRERD